MYSFASHIPTWSLGAAQDVKVLVTIINFNLYKLFTCKTGTVTSTYADAKIQSKMKQRAEHAGSTH